MHAIVNSSSRLIASKKNAKVSAWIFIFAVWTFVLEYALYVVSDFLLDKLIKISAFVCIVFFVRIKRNGMTRSEGILLSLFSLLFLSALIPSLLMGDFVGVAQWVKLALMSSILPILLFCRNVLREKEGLLLSTYITTGVVFSIQAAVAFFAVYWGVFDTSNTVEIERYYNMPEVTFGFWGYGNAIQTPLEGTQVLRSQGWFLEPSLLASFLLLPAFVSVGLFWKSRKKIYLFSSFITFFALFTTMSLAGYIAVVAGVLFLFLAKPFYRLLRKISFLKYSYPILILVVFYMVASFMVYLGQLANVAYTESRGDERGVITTLLRRDPDGPSGNLLREGYKLDNYISLIESNPLGVGFSFTNDTNEIGTGNGVIFWAVSGGIPAILLVAAFFLHIFFAFCNPLLLSENVILRCLAASFLGHAIHNLSYGNWLAPFFLVHLALVVMCARKLQDQPSDYN